MVTLYTYHVSAGTQYFPKERKKTDNPREGWENGTPPPHRDFKERSVVLAPSRRPHPWASAPLLSLFAQSLADSSSRSFPLQAISSKNAMPNATCRQHENAEILFRACCHRNFGSQPLLVPTFLLGSPKLCQTRFAELGNLSGRRPHARRA